ncbi:MAG TPA: group III truncated hemoglobin [Chitinophagaceae bacterium]|nr:group III truncated hemoglobin [Chitinophagaceae bacterium]
MKKDILQRSDVELLVNSFYDKVKKDNLISVFFTDVVDVQWESHLPTMYNFWQNVIFQTGGYIGNPMILHMNLDKMAPLNKEHFNRWTKLFTETVDELFEGDNAELAKQRALSIATVMQVKIHHQPPVSKSDSFY